MAIRFKIRRGLKSNLPALAEGEPGFTTDEKKLYVGASGGNVEIARADETVHTVFSGIEIYVKKTGNDATGDGTESNPFLTIQRAINEAGRYSTPNAIKNIHVGDGTYSGNINIRIPGPLLIGSIAEDASKVILEPTSNEYLLSANGCIFFRNITFRTTSFNAPAIYFSMGTVYLYSCVFAGSGAGNGFAAIRAETCCARIYACVMSGYSYGLDARSGNDIFIYNSTISNCDAGIVNTGCVIHQTNNTNTATTQRIVVDSGLIVNTAQQIG